MALLLHLSDLHLAVNDVNDVVADTKSDILDLGDQQTRFTILKNTLRALGEGLVHERQQLDSILVSGDITVRGQPEGFDLLGEVLDCLGGALPAPERILIIPGNHDVVRYSEPSSAARYEGFTSLRKKSYKTAYLEGIDIDSNGNRLGTPTDPLIVAEDESFVLLGLNSSNHCGSDTKTENKLAPHLSDLEERAEHDQSIRELLTAWKARGLADIARLDGPQLHAGHARLVSALKNVKAHSPLRIVALHHQVQPVTVTEEVKSFDAILNLGEFRDWLAANRVDVVLHGHKHEGKILPDSHLPLNASGATRGPHDMLLVSAPTIQVGQNGRDAIGYLIRVDGPSARIAGVHIAEVPSQGAGASMELSELPWNWHQIDQPSRHGVIEGETIDDVHGKLVAIRAQLDSIKTPLICRITDGNTAHYIPATYPELPPSFGDRQEWFTRMVDWWQDAKDLKSAAFTHGQRLYAAATGSSRSQVSMAIKALKEKPETSRAIAVLLDPSRDLASSKTEFPAFVLVQFTRREQYLDVTAYFRKQEMPHWWPINVSELARLQRKVLDGLRDSRDMQAGSITTVTAMPTSGSAIPRVAVPLLDQQAETYAGLLHLALPLFHLVTPRPETLNAWREVMEDWRPGASPAADGDRVPVHGFAALHETISALAATIADPSPKIQELLDAIQDIDLANSNFTGMSDEQAEGARGRWRESVTRKIDAVDKLLEDILEPNDSGLER